MDPPAQVFGLVKQQLGLKSKQKLGSLFKTGKGKYPRPDREGKAICYSDLSNCPDINTPDNRTVQNKAILNVSAPLIPTGNPPIN